MYHDATPRTIGSLFSGIGGLELGLERALGAETIWQVEIDPFCRSVLAKHWPDAERFDDVRAVGVGVLAPVDLICGGFPCQDVSAAGLGAGIAGSRSGLWFEFARIVSELCPEWVVVENVGSASKRWVDAVLAGLGELGYQALPFPLSAEDCGAPHLRRRVFVVGRNVAYIDGQPLRVGPERRSTRRPRTVRREGEAEPRHDGAPRNADGMGSPGWRDWPGWQDGPGCTPVLGMADGISARLDRPRLKALGNSVVPQCAEVIGWVIRFLATIDPT